LCGVLEHASAEILVFLELAQKSLVSASRTTQFPPEFLDGNGLAVGRRQQKGKADETTLPHPRTSLLSISGGRL
jgi:hypothetical protein